MWWMLGLIRLGVMHREEQRLWLGCRNDACHVWGSRVATRAGWHQF